MVVLTTGTSISGKCFVDLEELPDSCEGTGAPLLWLSCEGQTDAWEMFTDNSYLSAILDRQGLVVAVPVNSKTKKAEGFSPQALQGFWSKIKKKNKDSCDVPDGFHQIHYPKSRHMATIPSVLGHSRIPNSRWWTFPYFSARIRKELVVEESTMLLQKKYHCQTAPMRDKKTQVDFPQF